MKSKGEKERYKHLNAEFQQIAKRDKKAFFSDQCKEIEEKNRMGKTRDLFKLLQSCPNLCNQRWRSAIQSAKTRLGADCGSDHELLIAKFRHKLKKGGKTARPFRYDLNQIPYDYTVEVRNRFKALDLIESLMNYGLRFMTLYRRQGSRPSPWKRNAKKQNGCLGRPYKYL